MSDDAVRSREALTELRAATLARLAATTEQLDGLRQDRAVANDDDEHDPEGAPLSGEWSRLTGLADAARSRLQQIDDALARLDAGTYGRCAGCGRQIPAGRLQVRPFAQHCVPCAERRAR